MAGRLTSRQLDLLKQVPKAALFLFKSDNMTDVRPTKDIIDSRDNIVVGNVVTVKYNGEELTAEILKLSGN